ncbi:MAG: hypothetical protein Q4C91_14210 [Eubacteriales bacterium]|nr:hypothetical protein [Eubacteriales bacterium]
MKKMKILVYGEGPTDYGWQSPTGEWLPGPIVYLIRKCAEEFQVDLEIGYIEKKVIDGENRIKLGARHMRNLSGKGIPALRFSLYAKENGYTAGVFYCDTDRIMIGKNTKETDCKKYYEQIYSDVIQGLQRIGNIGWTGVPMISLKMIECWLLSDKMAYKKCFGKEPEKVKLPSKPELIWGEKNNPSSDYPKNYLRRVLEQYHKEADRDILIEIAKETETDTLKEKCPISFARFYEDFLEACTAA